MEKSVANKGETSLVHHRAAGQTKDSVSLSLAILAKQKAEL